MVADSPWQRLAPAAIIKQALDLRWVFAGIGILSGGVLGGLFCVWAFTEIQIADLTRDPLAVVETALLAVQRDPAYGLHALANLRVPFYAGALSNVGILLWASAAAVTLFAALMLRKRPPTGARHAGMFTCFGLLTSALMLDDLFLLHERAFPIHFGLDERWLFAAYGLLLLALLAGFAREILMTEFLVLFAAFAFFGGSLFVDVIPVALPQPHFFEDGSKFLGILCWTVWAWRTAYQQLESNA